MKPIKKSIIVGILLMGTSLASCQKEDITDSLNHQSISPILVQIGIDRTDAQGNHLLTKAAGDNSIPANCTLRNIIEIYAKGKNEPLVRQESFSTEYPNPQEVEIRLPVSNEYVIVCWSDFVKSTELTPFYNTSNLNEITQSNTLPVNNADMMDAYTGKLDFIIDKNGNSYPADLKLTLRRPLVRLEMQNITLSEVSRPASCNIQYKNTIPSSYSALTQRIVKRNKEKSAYSYHSDNPSTNPFNLIDYIFVDSLSTVNLNLLVSDGTNIYGKTKANIPEPITVQIPEPNMKFTIVSSGTSLSLIKMIQP